MVSHSPDPETLIHFGVKGMKWGIRKDKSTGSSPRSKETTLSEREETHAKRNGFTLSPNAKKAILITAGSLAVAGVLYGGYRYGKSAGLIGGVDLSKISGGDKISADTFNQLKAESLKKVGYAYSGGAREHQGFVVKAGDTFQRLSSSPERGFSNLTYATSGKDNARYMAGFVNDRNYLVNFKATRDVRVASTKDALSAFSDAVAQTTGKRPSASDVESLYRAESGGGWGGATSKKFFDVLKSKGFNGIIDEMDAGVYGERPMILFGDAFGEKNVSQLSPQKIKDILSDLTEIPNRIR